MTERRVAAGIYRTPSGWRFYVRVAGQLYARRLPATTPLQEVKDARAALRLELRGTPAARGSLAADVAKYLTIVAAMPTWRERRRHLEWWVRWLGPQRRRATITPGEIQAGLGALVVDGYAPQTVAHFRTALRHLWHVLDGRHATNPVRATVAPRPPAPGDRALTPAIVTAILGEFRRTSKTYARLAVMATTGLPQKQLMALTPTHVDLAARRLRRPGRAHGRRRLGAVLDLRDARPMAGRLRAGAREGSPRAAVPPVRPPALLGHDDLPAHARPGDDPASPWPRQPVDDPTVRARRRRRGRCRRCGESQSPELPRQFPPRREVLTRP